jgi:TonB family protein
LLTKQRRTELIAIVNAFAEERDGASYVAMVKLDESLHGEAFHPANAPMREELFALHDEAWAWRTAMESVLQGSSDTGYPLVDVRHAEDLAMRAPVAIGEKPLCPGKVQKLAKIRYPRAERKDLLVGSVIVDTGFDSGGNVVNPRILAAVPAEGGFKEAVLSASEKWKFVPDRDADLERCRVERDRHSVTVQFSLGVAR